ncbi:MAG: glycine cleavage system protein GcvH [Eubacteriales bacterium]|nr:glycine cleavage system protein GcvH [Eubacteriales bacterium]
MKTDRMYTKSHEWILFENDTTATIGLTDHAQEEMGDLVFVNLPQVGDAVTKDESLGDVESVKTVSDVYSPVTGSVAAVNEELLDAPQKINEDAYGSWLVKIENITDKTALLDAAAYEAFISK